MISTVSLLNELLAMPMTQRCHVLCFTILYLSTTEFPTHFSFFLNKHWNCLWFIYPNFERYLFPAESSLTLDLWNKAIFLSLSLSYLYIINICRVTPFAPVMPFKSVIHPTKWPSFLAHQDTSMPLMTVGYWKFLATLSAYPVFNV